jgi:RNA polymerase sigma factor (TIGR02999 family)
MPDVTRLLDVAATGDPSAAAELLPLVYDELRKLAAARLADEKPGQTLQPTSLVHEAYVRLVGGSQPHNWNGRGHFFAAAAEAMRRILVESARRKKATRHGGDLVRQECDGLEVLAPVPREDILALDEALCELSRRNREAAELVQLRYFGGLTQDEAAEALGISPRSAGRLWAYARAWLRLAVEGSSDPNNF